MDLMKFGIGRKCKDGFYPGLTSFYSDKINGPYRIEGKTVGRSQFNNIDKQPSFNLIQHFLFFHRALIL